MLSWRLPGNTAPARSSPLYLPDFEAAVAKIYLTQRTDPTSASVSANGCVARLYTDAVRRMGRVRRVEEEKERKSRSPTPGRSRDRNLASSRSASFVRHIRAGSSSNLLLKMFEAHAMAGRHARSHSAMRIGETRQAGGRPTAGFSSSRHFADGQEFVRRPRPPTLREQRAAEDLLLRDELRRKQAENTCKVLESVEDLELLYEMNPSKHYAELLVEAKRLRALKRQKTPGRSANRAKGGRMAPQTADFSKHSIRELNKTSIRRVKVDVSPMCAADCSPSDTMKLTKASVTKADW